MENLPEGSSEFGKRKSRGVTVRGDSLLFKQVNSLYLNQRSNDAYTYWPLGVKFYCNCVRSVLFVKCFYDLS